VRFPKSWYELDDLSRHHLELALTPDKADRALVIYGRDGAPDVVTTTR
jgi:hypothetical protein